jgi:signal transduction histidine kinase
VTRFPVWLILAVGFSALIGLITFSGWSSLQRARESYTGISSLLSAEQQTVQVLGKLRGDVQASAIVVRDFLLEPEAAADSRRHELQELQAATARDLAALEPLMLDDEWVRFQSLHSEINSYWHSLDPLVASTLTASTPAQKEQLSSSFMQSAFLRKQILPRRQAVLDLAAEIEALTAASVAKRRKEIDQRQSALPAYMGRVMGMTILLGLMIAGVSMFHIMTLEAVAARQHRKVVDAEKELRELSQQLVRAQEEERRSLSRELHDQIGQLMTAVRIGLGNLEEALGDFPDSIRHQLDQTKRISEQALRSVRDMAMGLRPSMLDDLGLGDALQWQARQHARLCGVPVSVELDGELDDLSDAQRTCIYRVVQEALNNVAKHAQASDIQVEVANRMGVVSIMVRDDGDGFTSAPRAPKGLGIVGIKERVRELGGQVTIDSQNGRGTSLWVIIPLRTPPAAKEALS